MNFAEYLITFLGLAYDDAHSCQIVNLVQGFALILHFAVDRIEMLGSSWP